VHPAHPLKNADTGWAGWLFGGPFDPHGHCYLWRGDLVWMHVASDFCITLAYYSIPIALVYFVRKRRDLAFNWMFLMFAAFILLCGTTHLVNIVVVWDALYYTEGVIKVLTAIASLGTAAALWPLIPRALALPSPDQLRRTNDQLHLQITERTRAEEALRAAHTQLEERVRQRTADLAEANAELERSNRDLEDFAYIAAHDLKEPLRSIHQLSEMALEDEAEDVGPRAAERLRRIQHVAGRMDSIINSLLEYSRVGHTGLAMAQVDLNAVVRDVVDSLRVMLDERRVQIRLPGPLPTLWCDSARVGEVFRNLIANAAKYNDKADKWIEIGVLAEQTARTGSNPLETAPPVLYVKDNGIGIPDRHRDVVFRMFKRLHGRDQFGGGVGAGLAIVKAIVERHGGRIWIESSPGQGTSFYFTLGAGS
jgi:signal transduction histidine kinase